MRRVPRGNAVSEADDLESIIYLTIEDVLGLYAAIIGGSATQASNQLRSRPSLESAIGRPAAHAHYERADLAAQAAVLAQGIAESQSFLDGNKRLALVAMLTFLEVNGYSVPVSDRELAEWIIGLSAGMTADDLAGRIRQVLTPVG
jgi:death-on-curing protein